MEPVKGRIFNIQKFSVHDGPGIRDIVFMKGCPLQCIWCANPESQRFDLQMGYQKSKCLGEKICGYCVQICPEQALQSQNGGSIATDTSRCTNCQQCVAVCPTMARRTFGEDVTVEEVYRRVQSQSSAWRATGGVTISGGEPLMQAKFLELLLKKMKENGIHTAIETSGYAPWEDFSAVVRLCDMVHMDVKILDSDKHKKFVGSDNRIILENLKKFRQAFPEKNIIVRTPVIPGINDKKEELFAIADFLQGIGEIQDYELLPYHSFGRGKYEQLQRQYPMGDLAAADANEVRKINDELRAKLGLKQGGFYSGSV